MPLFVVGDEALQIADPERLHLLRTAGTRLRSDLLAGRRGR